MLGTMVITLLRNCIIIIIIIIMLKSLLRTCSANARIFSLILNCVCVN